ncbi:MAG: ABC transporter substrate-binding protein [Gammaproteobacteria bacterium]
MKIIQQRFIQVTFIIAAVGLSLAASADEKDAAIATVEKLHATLLEVMQQASALGFGGRVEKLDPVLNESFDFATISRIVTGQHWKTLDAEKQARFVDTFSRLSVATYASNFSGFSGEQFKTETVDEKRGRYVVRTKIIKNDGEEISLDYVVAANDGMLQIINVIAEGVSDLSLKRADYTAVIDTEGFDSLLGRLDEKLSGLGN